MTTSMISKLPKIVKLITITNAKAVIKSLVVENKLFDIAVVEFVEVPDDKGVCSMTIKDD